MALFSHNGMLYDTDHSDGNERGAARNTDPQTSHEAAASVDATRLEAKVLAAINVAIDGLTSTEAAQVLNIPPWSISPRFRPLARKGLIHDTGMTRIGATGRRHIVWKSGPEKEQGDSSFE